MLTNNKKSYFVKGIAMLMAMLMVLSVCLTGCGKKADEAIQKADDAQASADEAKTAADAVKAALAEYLTKLDGATKAEVDAKIEAALAPYATTEALGAYVKSTEFDKLLEDLKGYVTKAALDEALKGCVTDAEQAALEKSLTDLINANKGNIEKALNDLKAVATDAEVDAIKKALEDKIAAADKAAADAAEAMKGYVKNDDDYANLVRSVQEHTMQLMTIDHEHYGKIKEALTAELQAYVKAEDYDALAKSVDEMAEELNRIETDHEEYIKTVLADYVGTSTFDLLATRVQTLETSMDEISDHVKQIENDYGTKLDGLFGMITQLAEDTQNMGKEIQGALLDYATAEELKKLDGRVEKLEEVVKAILEAFYSEDVVADMTDSTFTDMLDMPAEVITALIKDKMSLKEWNDATFGKEEDKKVVDGVITTIDNIQALLSKIYKDDPAQGLRDAYTDAAKAEINNYLKPFGLVLFDAAGDVTPYNKNAKQLEYTILRVATLAELQVLKDAIEDANEVKNFKEELADLFEASLFAETVGHTHTATTPDKLTVQTVTIANKGDINDFVKAYDALIVKYLNDNAFANTIYAANYGKQNTYNIFEKDGVQKIAATDKYFEEVDAKNNPIYWEKKGITILTEDADGNEWANGTKLHTTDDNGLIYLPQDIELYKWTAGAITTAKINGHYGSQANLTVSATYKNAEGTYRALVTQIKEAQALVNAANEAMEDFLTYTVKEYGRVTDAATGKSTALKEMTTINPEDYLAALTVAMCTPVKDDIKPLYYLLTDVATAMNAAMARNTCVDADHTARKHDSAVKTEIERYQLYFDMYDKAWGLTFDLFKSYALNMYQTILYDYISVIDYYLAAPALPGTNDTTLALDASWVTTYKYGDYLTEGFLGGFLNNDGTFKGWYSFGDTVDQAAIHVTKDFEKSALVNYYGLLNGTAKSDATTDITAAPAATIRANSERVRMHLTAAAQNVYLKLFATTKDNVDKDKYQNDIAGIFEDLLNEEIANLDEVYNRFLFEDYKAAKINEVYAHATKMAALYDGFTNDVATYKAGTVDVKLIEAMEHYLTGYSVTAATAADGPKNKLFPDVDKLVNAALKDELAGKVVNPLDKIDGVNAVPMTATNMMNEVDVIINGYKLTLENMAIKDNFQTYLDTATDNIAHAYLDYMMAKGNTYEVMNNLVGARNGFDTIITVTKLQEDMGKIEIDDYIDQYKGVLGIIAGKDQEVHLVHLFSKSFAAAKSELKSTESREYLVGTIHDLVVPFDAVGTGDNYNFVGECVYNFDKIINVNTQYKVYNDKHEFIGVKNLY
ncbi:MAG: hypothetical protein E7594_05095 [Ruminococcaceae bacterium]|nr:hypothetical protein [Oscillospiraceae bacterium]MBE6676201.1 hypothetical protein [Oscillospiraceae bacterium]